MGGALRGPWGARAAEMSWGCQCEDGLRALSVDGATPQMVVDVEVRRCGEALGAAGKIPAEEPWRPGDVPGEELSATGHRSWHEAQEVATEGWGWRPGQDCGAVCFCQVPLGWVPN